MYNNNYLLRLTQLFKIIAQPILNLMFTCRLLLRDSTLKVRILQCRINVFTRPNLPISFLLNYCRHKLFNSVYPLHLLISGVTRVVSSWKINEVHAAAFLATVQYLDNCSLQDVMTYERPGSHRWDDVSEMISRGRKRRNSARDRRSRCSPGSFIETRRTRAVVPRPFSPNVSGNAATRAFRTDK